MRRSLLPTAALLAPALLLGCGPRPAPTSSTDARTPLTLAPEAQDAVLAEMRAMLGSLNGILTGLATGDTAAMVRAATASGLAAAADPALEKVLPEQFLQLGMATHRQFDSLATLIGAGLARDSVLARLGRLTGTCVSCHATYRLNR